MANYIGSSNAYKTIGKMPINNQPFENSIYSQNNKKNAADFDYLVNHHSSNVDTENRHDHWLGNITNDVIRSVGNAEKSTNNFINSNNGDLISLVEKINTATIEVKKAIPVFREIIKAYKEIMQLPL